MGNRKINPTFDELMPLTAMLGRVLITFLTISSSSSVRDRQEITKSKSVIAHFIMSLHHSSSFLQASIFVLNSVKGVVKGFCEYQVDITAPQESAKESKQGKNF